MKTVSDLQDLIVHPLLVPANSFTVCQTTFNVTEQFCLHCPLNVSSAPVPYRSYGDC